jgi:hypothetical protein
MGEGQLRSQGPQVRYDGILGSQHQGDVRYYVQAEYRPHRAGSSVKQEVAEGEHELGGEEYLRPWRDRLEARQEPAPEQGVDEADKGQGQEDANEAGGEALSPLGPTGLEGVEYVHSEELLGEGVERGPDHQRYQDTQKGIVPGDDGDQAGYLSSQLNC